MMLIVRGTRSGRFWVIGVSARCRNGDYFNRRSGRWDGYLRGVALFSHVTHYGVRVVYQGE
jgi:hypothetical protein